MLGIAVPGTLGYFGLLTGRYSADQPFKDGWRGALIGCGIGLVVLLFAFVSTRASSGRSGGHGT